MLAELRGVVKEFESPAGVCRALNGLDLEVEVGELVALVGISGSGKSTLLNVLTGLDRPSAGEVKVAGQDLPSMDESALAKWRGQQVGVVFQFFQLLPTLTVQENVALAMDLVGSVPGPERARRSAELLDRVGLADQARKYPDTLSGGQQQRAAIARALANDPALLVADEPTGNLDRENGLAIRELFQTLQQDEGRTLVVATHDPLIAEGASRVVEIEDGAVREATS